MDVQAFTQALRLASGSLERLEYLAILTHFCFQPNQVYAFDGHTATVVNLEHDLHCAVRGDVLIQVLQQPSNKLKVQQVDNECHVRDGRSLVKLPIIEHKAFLYQPPKEFPEIIFTAGADFFDALEMSINNVASPNYKEELAGVTLRLSRDKVITYAFDFVSILRCTIPVQPVKWRDKATLILSKQFAERAAKIYSMLGDSSYQARIVIGKTTVQIHFTEAGVQLVGTLVPATPVDYEGTLLKKVVPEQDPFPVPPTLASGLEKCVVLIGEDIGVLVRFATGEEGIRLLCKGHYGHANIRLAAPALPESRLDFSAKVLLRHLSRAETMNLTLAKDKQAVHFANPTMLYVVGKALPVDSAMTDDAAVEDDEDEAA